jgi:hypothetical protein
MVQALHSHVQLIKSVIRFSGGGMEGGAPNFLLYPLMWNSADSLKPEDASVSSILCGLKVQNTNSVQWWNKVGLGEREGEQSGAPPCIPLPEKFNLMALFRCARA